MDDEGLVGRTAIVISRVCRRHPHVTEFEVYRSLHNNAAAEIPVNEN